MGRYAIGPPIGAGGMTTVYRTNDERHGREVALTVLGPELSEALGRERFLREIHLAESYVIAGEHARAVALLHRAAQRVAEFQA